MRSFTIHRPTRMAALAAASLTLLTLPTWAAFPLVDLSQFYLVYQDPRVQDCGPTPLDTTGQAELAIIGGGAEPPAVIGHCTKKRYRTIHGLVGIEGYDQSNNTSNGVNFYSGAWYERCGGEFSVFRKTGAVPQPLTNWYRPRGPSELVGSTIDDPCVSISSNLKPPGIVVESEYITQPLIRRRAVDGGEYDASPLVVKRNGALWYTHYWAYQLGLVANESNFKDADRSLLPVGWDYFPSSANNFELAKLPPPRVEEEVTEYVSRTDFPNQPSGQYFYAVLTTDKTLLDSTANWSRTGKSFKSGGYVSVCRFYGGKNGGPNTHFYSADDKECAALKNIPALSYEGQTFAVNMPMPAKNAAQSVPGALRDCPIDSKPLYRVYNNASNSGGRFVSNHRYLTERADVTAAVAQGWVDEGHVMCVPN